MIYFNHKLVLVLEIKSVVFTWIIFGYINQAISLIYLGLEK